MNDNATPIATLIEKAEEFGKTTFELFKLEAIDKSADVVSSLATRLTICLVLALFVLIANIGIALWIGELLGKYYYGFFALASIYALILVVLYAFRNQWIKYPVSNSIINLMLKQKVT